MKKLFIADMHQNINLVFFDFLQIEGLSITDPGF